MPTWYRFALLIRFSDVGWYHLAIQLLPAAVLDLGRSQTIHFLAGTRSTRTGRLRAACPGERVNFRDQAGI